MRWAPAPLVARSISTYSSLSKRTLWQKNAVWTDGEHLRAVSSRPSTGLLSVGSIQRVKPITSVNMSQALSKTSEELYFTSLCLRSSLMLRGIGW